MKYLLYIILLFFLSGCTSTSFIHYAREKRTLSGGYRIGETTKANVVNDYQKPKECKKDEGDENLETCFFTRWIGTRYIRDTVKIEKKDLVHAFFSYDGILRDIQTDVRR